MSILDNLVAVYRSGRLVSRTALFAGLMIAFVFAAGGTVSAQDTDAAGMEEAKATATELAPLSADERAALIGRMTDAQARDLLFFYLEDTAPKADADEGTGGLSIEAIRAKGTAFRDNLAIVLSKFGSLFVEYGKVMEDKLSIGIGEGGILLVIVYVLGLSAAGGVAEFLFRYGTRGMVERYEAAPVDTTRQRLSRALGQLGHGLAAIGIFAAGYAGVFLAIWGGHVERRDFTIVVLMAILLTRVSVALVRFVFLPNHPTWRIMPCDDEAAAHFVRGTRRQVILGSVLLLFSMLGWMWDVERDVWRLGALLSAVIFTISYSVFLWRYRRHLLRAVEDAIEDGSVPRWAEDAAGWTWYVFAVGYVLIAFLLGVYALLLSLPFKPLDAAIGFIILFVAYPYLTAVLTGLVDTKPNKDETAAEKAADEAPAVRKDRRVMKRVISIAALIVSLSAFSAVVGVDIFSTANEYPVAQFLIKVMLNVGVIALLGYVAWAFVASKIDRKLAEEQAASPMPETPDDGPAMQGGTRLQTTLPIIRKFIQVSIAVISVMVVLASMGVNIAPLIAGAGVIGLAIGFGAQTLVKDLISGLFFLMDDAFRIGEYIECGSSSGTVEKFNARSIVLRGYLGAVYTVPYGEIGPVTNFSRDWVIMKLRFRVPYDTDIDLVRKLFKKIGREMLEDPEMGPGFIQPFKSQGVIKMDDSAFIVSGKFMTKPNKQWAVRKAVYERVQKTFKEYGIKFAPKRVIVDVPQAEDLAEINETGEVGAPGGAPAGPPTAPIVPAVAAAAAIASEGGKK